MRDMHLSYAVIEQIDSAAELFQALFDINIGSANFRAQMAAREIRLSQLLLTALARLALDERLAIEPIEEHRLTAMRDAVMTNHGRPARLNDKFRRLNDRVLTERLDADARKRTADLSTRA